MDFYTYASLDIKGNLVPIDFTKEKYVEYIKTVSINNTPTTIFQMPATIMGVSGFGHTSAINHIK